jgi:uncharacterized membrane protein
VRRLDDPAIETSLRVLALAAILTTLADTIIDPVAYLGEHWFLGDLYTYAEDGIHFGVPLSNYAGWLLTTAMVVFVNQRFDGWLRARGTAAHGFHLPFKPLWALGSYLGNSAFMIAVIMYLIVADDVPSSVPLGSILASTLALSGAFVLFAFFMIRRAFNRGLEPLTHAPSPVAAQEAYQHTPGDGRKAAT